MSVLPRQPLASLRRPISALENGDRLTRAEFERRYQAMPHVKKAELIGGIVYMTSPVRHSYHGFQHVILSGWLAYYLSKTPGVQPSDNATLRLDEQTEPQPDLLLRIPESAGGRSKVSEDGYLEGPVELVAEIAASTVSLDAHAKLEAYRRHGVREYLVWRVDDAALDWFVLRDDRYEPLLPQEKGWLHSEVFPGLWLDPAALIAGDMTAVFRPLDAGATTTDHAAFVERLKGVK
jgi:hypothetical protein